MLIRANPHKILLANTLPIFAEDIHQLIVRIIEEEKAREEELDMLDAFHLYKQLSAVRQNFANSLPEYVAYKNQDVFLTD
jgi:hypothetical protein